MSVEEQPQQQQRSLYRRHRPRTFADVVGQEPVVRTLSNAVQQGKVHHAYLFVGSRGTGKTSMAKILAACLNCENGPTIEPCGKCESCVSIAAATDLDVTAVQLLWAAAREAKKAGVGFSLTEPPSRNISATLDEAGLQQFLVPVDAR